jgi:UPF0755 protein
MIISSILSRKRLVVCLNMLICGVLWLSGCASSAGERALSAYLSANEDELNSPVSVSDQPVPFVVAPGTPASLIGQELTAAGLIDDAFLFEAYVRINGLAGSLEAGSYLLTPSMTIIEIATALQNSSAAAFSVTLPEGWRLEQMAEAFADAGTLTDDRYLVQARSGDLGGLDLNRYPFLIQKPTGTSLEGYLFPDTYRLPLTGLSGAEVLAQQLDVFKAKVLPLYDAAVAEGRTALTLHEVLTLASIVEREAVVPAERAAIAGVYLNRLAIGMKLDADPTVQYAMGYQPESGQWWKTPVFLEEYSSVVSPYNTYLNQGLPPGPIASPGVASIQAVLQPEQHDYLYFVAIPDGGGKHVFARTYDEHIVNTQKYLAGP